MPWSSHARFSTALERAAGVVPPPEAVKVRNILEAAQMAWDHGAHLTILAAPDYGVYGLAGKACPNELVLDLDKYYQLLRTIVLPYQRLLHEIMAIFGGKSPHRTTEVPGGVTVEITPDKIEAAYSRWLQARDLFSKLYDHVKNVFLPHLLSEHPDVADLFLNIGVGVKNFLSYGFLDDPEDPTDINKRFLKPGVIINGEKQSVDVSKISEDVAHSWYTSDSGGQVSREPPPKPYYGKTGAYTWAKAPRYNGYPCEVGPLARMIIAGKYKPLSKHGASLLDRILARLENAKLVLDLLGDLILSLKPGARVWSKYEVPVEGEGHCLHEAPRGALLHYVRIEGRKIARYQAVVPSTWNISPRDSRGVRGPIEQALIGTPASETETINVLRVVRSFDPCLACTVHIVLPDKTIIKNLETIHGGGGVFG